MVLAAVSAVACYLAVIAKGRLGYDDSLDVFGIHGVGSILGVLGLTFVIRHQAVPGLQAAFAANGHVWSVLNQFEVQCTGAGLAAVYAAGVSIVLLVLVEKTLGFRLDSVRESAGMDHSLHGEHGYGLMNLQ